MPDMQLWYNIHSTWNIYDVLNSQSELMTVVAIVSLCNSIEELCIQYWFTSPYNKPLTVPTSTQKSAIEGFHGFM